MSVKLQVPGCGVTVSRRLDSTRHKSLWLDGSTNEHDLVELGEATLVLEDLSTPDVRAPSYDVDVLHCPRCSGRLDVIAAISEPSLVTKILAHLGLPTSLPQPAPARAPPWSDLDLDFDLDPDLELDEDLSTRS